MKKLLLLITGLLLLFSVEGQILRYSNYTTPIPSEILVTSIDVWGTGGATTISTNGGTLQMLKKTLPTNAADTTVTWSRTNGTGTADISAGGLLTALTNGTVTVRATANDGSAVYGEEDVTISNQVVAAPSFLTSDGYTEAWWIADAGNFTKTGGSPDYITWWFDETSNSIDLDAPNEGARPTYSANGILFDGTDYLMSLNFDIPQPVCLYVVLRQITSDFFRRIFSFTSGSPVYNIEQRGTTYLRLNMGDGTIQIDNAPLNTWCVMRFFLNGQSSKVQVNNLSATTVVETMGTGATTEIVIAKGEANVEFKEIIVRSIDDSSTDEQAIVNYLMTKYSIVE
jgi:hypothetical protein